MENVLRWLARGCVEEGKGGLSWPESHRTRELRRREVDYSGSFSWQTGRHPRRAGMQLACAQPRGTLGSPQVAKRLVVLADSSFGAWILV